MRMHVTSKFYCFRHPFFVSYLGKSLPAGNYCVEAYDQVVIGEKFMTYEPVLVLLHMNASKNAFNSGGVIPIDPDELELIFMKDQEDSAVWDFLEDGMSEQEEDLVEYLNDMKRYVREPSVSTELAQ